jgi:uncharacterized membrane protein
MHLLSLIIIVLVIVKLLGILLILILGNLRDRSNFRMKNQNESRGREASKEQLAPGIILL